MNRDQFLKKCDEAYQRTPQDEDDDKFRAEWDAVLYDGLDDDGYDEEHEHEHEPDGTEHT